MIVDAHVHYTPPQTPAELAAFAAVEPYWGLMLAPRPGATSVQGWATPERLIDDIDAAGIDKVVLLGEYRRQHEGCVARNDVALAITRRWPDRVIAFAMVQPLAGQAALDELKRCLDGGMAGVGELGPYGQGYRLDDPAFLRLAEACIDADIPINLHTNEEVGHYYPGKAATPLRDYYRLASRYPELKLILAHWGGGLLFYELMPEVRRRLANVWYDTAASPLMYPTARIFAAALACVDHRKLLYASDYPLLVYPRRQTEPDFRPFLDEIERLELEPEVRTDIMGGNMARLLGFTPHPSTASPASAGASAQGALSAQGARRAPRLSPVLTEVDPSVQPVIDLTMATSAVAVAWPETQAVFARYGIPWQDSPVPFWEPISQAAAARGYDAGGQQRLVDELNGAIATGRTEDAE